MAYQGGAYSPRPARQLMLLTVVAVTVLLAAACQDWSRYMGDPAH
jgi:hypothetical protein